MLGWFIDCIKRLRHNKFVVNYIVNTWLYQEFIYYIWKDLINSYYYHRYISHEKPNTSFYIENAERVNAVCKILADEKSKKTYLGMTKFRSTYKKKDFPFSSCERKQYYIKELKLGNNEVFVDCGAYDGDTINRFFFCFPNYKQIISLEPQSYLFKCLSNKYGNNPKITLINAGVSNEDGIASFYSGGDFDGSARIIESSPNKMESDLVTIKVKTIDGLDLQNVTFIKMDIEGAELNALKGAEKTILRDKPKLAICIYHSDDDMVRIAEYIHDLLPEYKLYVRQYLKYSTGETVLYALP
jgi:FkbM family methyltransferase